MKVMVLVVGGDGYNSRGGCCDNGGLLSFDVMVKLSLICDTSVVSRR